ncbi:MAG: Xaa-Pro peptidase family protein [Bryobacteraceae bacterium]|nr:Xaa-Pro peptidase family protein [Bryobacteraceae bacterium]
MRTAVLILLAASLFAGIPAPEFRDRRAKLQKAFDGILVLSGHGYAEETRDGFFQEPNFHYLTGWTEPGAVLILTAKEELLLIPERSERTERYNGKKLAPGDPGAEERTGFAKVLPVARFGAEMQRLMADHGRIYVRPADARAEKLKAAAPLHEILDPSNRIAAMRMKKSALELDLIRRATEATVQGHREAWRSIAPARFEYQIAAAMEAAYRAMGCERNAYPPIVGSGPNSVVLHYNSNRRKMDSGELVVMDVGAECGGYAADITRTVPVNGRFTPRQREIYDIVLGAQNAAIAAVKPGMKFRGETGSIESVAKKYITDRGYGKFWLHGLGHHVGLEVHDSTDPELTLQAGMVITIEPGIYIAEENLGVRIEDMILVTETGAQVISSALPRDPKEIEKLVQKP